MAIIDSSQSLIGVLESGDVNRDLTAALEECFSHLSDLSEYDRKNKIKGSLTLNLKFEVANGMITIASDIKTKLPPKPRINSVYWILDGGKLSTQHPQQHDMFREKIG